MYQLIFSSQYENALPKLRKQQLVIDAPKLVKHQIVIKNEMDLHQKVVSYIRKYYPDTYINSSLGENQDTSEKRIVSYKAGYTKGRLIYTLSKIHWIILRVQNTEWGRYCIALPKRNT
jgi:hypothetical protein